MRSGLVLTTAFASSLYATTSLAAVKAQHENALRAPVKLQEITVTATRRVTDLQKTPMAISVIDRSLIDEAAPQNIGDLAAFVPNFSAAKITGFNAASFAMRGIGQNTIVVYSDAPVGVVVDGFVMPSIQTQLLSTFDLAQVEVLRGPQGTLFGANTIGGAIVIHTIKPKMNHLSAKARASYGSFGDVKVEGATNIPLVPNKLALRLVGRYERSDGYMRNGASYGPIQPLVPSIWSGVKGKGNGAHIGGIDVLNGRVKLLFTPTNDISALFQYEFLRDKSGPPGTVNVTPNDPGQFAFAALGLAGGTGNPIDLGGQTGRTTAPIDMNRSHINVNGYYLTLRVHSRYGAWISHTGYRTQFSELPQTYPGVAPVAPNGEILSLFDANREDQRNTFEEDAHFASAFSGPLNFVAGLYFQHQTIAFCGGGIVGFLDLLGSSTPYGPWNNNPYALCSTQVSTSKGLYTNVTYKITKKLTLTAGARYTWEHKKWMGRQQTEIQDLLGNNSHNFSFAQLGSLLNAANFIKYPAGVVTNADTWKDPTWTMSLGYQINRHEFGYLTYSRGFNSGVYNDETGAFAPFGNNLAAFKAAARPANPETADSYEIGLKSEAFGRRLRLNIDGFWVTYRNLQEQIVVPISANGQPFEVTTFFNAAKMEDKGIEAELTALPVSGLTLRAILGYQNAKYDSYVTPIAAGYDLASAPPARAPKWQWTLGATYTMPLRNQAMLSFNADVNHVSRNLFTQSLTSASDNTYLNSRTLLNGSITLANSTDTAFVSIIGRNLTNKIYRTSAQVVAGLFSFATYAAPRSFTLEVGKDF